MILNVDSILKSTKKLESHSIPPHVMIVAIKSIVILNSSSLTDEISLNIEEPLYRLQIRWIGCRKNIVAFLSFCYEMHDILFKTYYVFFFAESVANNTQLSEV